jgi:ribosomal subunit interface protein
MDVGDALRSRISDELLSSIGKYFERGGDADVVVGKNGHSFQVDCSVRLASGHRLESSGAGGDAHSAFGDALNKVEARIRRYKRRLKNHHHPSGKIAETASIMVLRAPETDDDIDGWDEDVRPGHSSHEPPKGVVIAETQAPLKTMTVSMAVMELDLTETHAVVFRNAAHGGLSVVYRRQDGNIGWIDPERTRSSAAVGSV